MRWPVLMLALSVPLTASAATLTDATCSLDGTGDFDVCEKTYWRSRIIAAAIPSYTFSNDGKRFEHGLAWNVSFDLPTRFWASYFTLGKGPPPTIATNPFQLNVGAAFAWFPTNSELVGRLVLRSRIVSLAWPNSPALSFVHISVGMGLFVNRDGPGPRVELRIRVGHLAWGGVAIAVGYQPSLSVNRHVGDVAIGVEAPWMWWW